MKPLIWTMSVTLLLTGCNTDQAAKVMDSMGKLRGAHEARGGVILDGGKGGDWQVSRCDASNGSVVLSTSDSKPLLTVRKSIPMGAILHVPGGATLNFSSEQCPVIKWQDDTGHITVDCKGNGHEVLAGVNTVKCGG